MEEEKKEEILSEEPVQVTPAPVVEQAVQVANVAEKAVQQAPAPQPQQETVTYDKSLYDPDYEEKSGKGVVIVIGVVVGIIVIGAILAMVLLPMLFSSKNSIRKTDGASEMIRTRERVESVDSAY